MKTVKKFFKEFKINVGSSDLEVIRKYGEYVRDNTLKEAANLVDERLKNEPKIRDTRIDGSSIIFLETKIKIK